MDSKLNVSECNQQNSFILIGNSISLNIRTYPMISLDLGKLFYLIAIEISSTFSVFLKPEIYYYYLSTIHMACNPSPIYKNILIS